MSLSWASKEATEAVLKELGFTQIEPLVWETPEQWRDREFDCEIQAMVYLSNAGYYCVTLDGEGAWSAPVTWAGPKADWDKSDVRDEFVAWMNKYYG